LDFLGFPWILSSESSLINGLRGTNREDFFIAVFPRVSRLERESTGLGAPESRLVHGSKHNLASDFLQVFVVRPVSAACRAARSLRKLMQGH
jgi:hypothetical protein